MNVKKFFGLAAIAGLMFVAAPTQQANAVSLNNPGVAATVNANEGLTTQVQYRRHHHHGHRHHHVRRHHGWHRPHHVRRHHHWHRPHFHHQRRHHWR